MTTAPEDGKTLRTINLDDVAIGIQISASVGQQQQMTITSALPLAMPLKDCHRYVDKMYMLAERQNTKALIAHAKLLIEGHERDLAASIAQEAGEKERLEEHHRQNERRGPFRPTEAQQTKLNQYRANQHHIVSTLIPNAKKGLEELEAKLKKLDAEPGD